MESLSDLLSQHGVDNKKAALIQNRISGSDLMNLISFLKDGSPNALDNANKILSNFGVRLMENDISFNKLVKTVKNIIPCLTENNIPYRKYGENLYTLALNENSRVILEKKLKETAMDYKSRIMELAGIVPGASTTFGTNDTTSIDTTDIDDGSDIDTDSVITTVPDSEDDLDVDAAELGSFDTVDNQPTMVPQANSVELNQILDYLNNIQQLIPDVRVSEFKTMRIKIQDLYNQTQGMGDSYLQ